MNQLIGVAGKARAGKDSFVRSLTEFGYVRGAFADALKQVTALVANEPLHNFTDDVLKEQHSDLLEMTRRRALQNVGNMMRQTIHDRIWVERLLNTWEKSGRIPMAISDVRYANEAEAVRKAGGVVILITRPGFEGLTGEAASHISEQALPPELVDATVVNDGSLNDLSMQAERIATYVKACYLRGAKPSEFRA